ncbi:MAG: Fatty acid metabolism regulator protein [Candidatus Erwinia impunctatus]|nr:Fatty acid metabolism regulator protein [Culicoides impunctatus]
MIIKANSPAAFAEEYIINCIWSQSFPAGSILPSERELSESIGITRTTLREVLQRLARDGWLTIQHGKPTQVNNVWETSGLNLLETVVRLDTSSLPRLMDNLLSVRTNVSALFVKSMASADPEQLTQLLEKTSHVEDGAEAYSELEYTLLRELAFASGNMIYGLMINGLKGIYARIGRLYFSNPQARNLAKDFYQQLHTLCQTQQFEKLVETMSDYGTRSCEIWHRMQKNAGPLPAE